MIHWRLNVQLFIINSEYNYIIWPRDGGGTRGDGSVVAYGYATYLALYYTYLALFSLLMVANQRNMFMIITCYGEHLMIEAWFFVFFLS